MRSWRDRYRHPGGPLARRRGGGGSFLAYPDGVTLSGAAGSYIWCPDSAALSFNNDIEVVMKVKCTDWSAAANQTLVAKYLTTGNQRSWRLYANSSAALLGSVSSNGTAVTTTSMAPSVALPDATTIWLRMRLDLTNGTNSVLSLDTDTATSSNSEPSSWTANGSGTGTAMTAVFDSTARLEIGSFAHGANERLAGTVYRVIVRDGFSGATVADFDSLLSGVSGYTDAYGNVWTVAP